MDFTVDGSHCAAFADPQHTPSDYNFTAPYKFQHSPNLSKTRLSAADICYRSPQRNNALTGEWPNYTPFGNGIATRSFNARQSIIGDSINFHDGVQEGGIVPPISQSWESDQYKFGEEIGRSDILLRIEIRVL